MIGSSQVMNVGAAEIDVTPDFPVDLSGYAMRRQPSAGVIEPIFARALFLHGGDEKLLWIACDLIALRGELVEEMRRWAGQELGLEPRQVLLTATHTHAAPAVIHLNACGDYSERYVALLRGKLQHISRLAASATTPSALVTASAPLNLSIDRRKKPSSHTDPTVFGVAFVDSTGERVATIVNYAMHPVTLGRAERRISPDWPGGVASVCGPNTLVTNGAAGNIDPPMVNQPPEQMKRYGETVGRAALDALASASPQIDPALVVRSIHVPMELEWHDEQGIDRIADEYLGRIDKFVWGDAFRIALEAWRTNMKRTIATGGGREFPIELHAIRLGDAVILAINGELFSRFAQMLRQRTGRKLFVVGYANAAFGYIPTREAYAEGGYEVETAHFFYNSFRPRAGSLEMLADRAAELIMAL